MGTAEYLLSLNSLYYSRNYIKLGEWVHLIGFIPNVYFWRDHQKREIDYLEEEDGKLRDTK